MSEKTFTPDWTNKPPTPGSYRSIVKEGRQDQIEIPSQKYFLQLQKELHLDKEYFTNKRDGNQPLGSVPPSILDKDFVDEITTIVGRENVQLDDYSRVKYSYGKNRIISGMV